MRAPKRITTLLLCVMVTMGLLSGCVKEKTREESLPDDAVKVTPENDVFPPMLHSSEWMQPVPMSGSVNTAGAEDSPFITPDGSRFFFFFTPDVDAPADEQLMDGVTGIWWCNKVDGVWGAPERIVLSKFPSLDDAPFAHGNTLWFASVRHGNYGDIDFYTAEYRDGKWMDWENAGKQLNQDYDVGELHIIGDGENMYCGRETGNGSRDLWVLHKTKEGWSEPLKLPPPVNTDEYKEDQPFITPRGDELWFTGESRLGYPGPAVFRCVKTGNGSWSEPEEVLSNFSGEPTLDGYGNLYFVHHFFDDNMSMVEADIYVAYRKSVTPVDSPRLPQRGFFMGVLPTPAEGQTFEEAYYQASEYAEFVPVWGQPTSFYNLPETLIGEWGQTFVETYSRGNGMFPIIHLSFIGEGLILETPPELEDATLSDPEWSSAYKQAACDVVKAVRPLYLSLGNEVNRWFEQYGMDEDNPNGFQHYVTLYGEIYDEIKKLSPETKVFCTFAREIVSENREADLSVLSLFNPEKIDLLVFTSYPYAVQGINMPSDIPDDYYSKAFDYMLGKPFGFTELGWPSLEFFGGEHGQVDFLKNVSSRLTVEQGINLHLLGWAWLHDLDENDAVGLIRRDGTEKIAYRVWKNMSQAG